MRRPYFVVNTLNERPGLPQGTNIHFPHRIGWEGTPAFFCLNAASAACTADVTNVVCFDMFIELFPKFLYSLAVRHTGKRLTTMEPVRVTRESAQSGAYSATVTATLTLGSNHNNPPDNARFYRVHKNWRSAKQGYEVHSNCTLGL